MKIFDLKHTELWKLHLFGNYIAQQNRNKAKAFTIISNQHSYAAMRLDTFCIIT